jgi:hypothetical protein
LFCRTTVSEEPDEGDKFKNTNNDEDKKQRNDCMWASFKEGTDTKEAKRDCCTYCNQTYKIYSL